MLAAILFHPPTDGTVGAVRRPCLDSSVSENAIECALLWLF